MLTLSQRLLVLLAILGQALGALGVPTLTFSEDGQTPVEMTPCGCPIDSQLAQSCCCFKGTSGASCAPPTTTKPKPIPAQAACCSPKPEKPAPQPSCCSEKNKKEISSCCESSAPPKVPHKETSSCCDHKETSSCCESPTPQKVPQTEHHPKVQIHWQMGQLAMKARCQGHKDVGGSPVSGTIGLVPNCNDVIAVDRTKEVWNHSPEQDWPSRQENPPAPPPKALVRTLATARLLSLSGESLAF